MRITPKYVDVLQSNQIFVFGSNLKGRHGAGAALLARNKFGAVYNKGIGIHGNSYAIPTKDINLVTLPLEEISNYVEDFIYFAKEFNDYEYLVTEIGCGLAGYNPEQIAPMFARCLEMSNIYLPLSFYNILINN